jgi:hypothetical protein
VFNGALEVADPPDFLNAADLLTSSGMKGATVVLDVMPNRFLEFSQLENPLGNQARRFERLLGHGAVSSLLAEIRRPLVILDPDILMNCLSATNRVRQPSKLRVGSGTKQPVEAQRR